MNYSGKFDAKLSADGSGLQADGHAHVETTAHHATHAPADAIIVPDAQLLFNGDFKRSGVDLVLTRDDHELVLHDYFKGEKRAALASPDGAHLNGDLVSALTGHTEYAQADGSASAGHVIGHVTKLVGTATAIRNGVSVILNNGDNVEKGDVVASGSDSTLGITFIDGTVFGLSSNARMVLNEMVYDPNGSDNSSLMSLVAGTISFVAGETAKHGDMKVDTPVATMGIRGTAVLVEIDFNVPGTGGAPDAKFQVLVEPDGTTGSYILFDKNTLTPIATVNQAGQQINISQGQVSISNAPLSDDVQKLITDVFSLKFTDNSNTKTYDHFTDSIVPQSLQPFILANGTSATPVIINVPTTTDAAQKGGSGTGPTLQHIAEAPLAVILDANGNPATGFFTAELAGKTGDVADFDTVSGRVNFADINAGDAPTVSAKFTSFTYQNAAHTDVTATLNALQLADIAAVEAKLLVVPAAGNNNNGSATWTYSVADKAFDFLAAGETLTLTYTATVDNNYAPSDQTTPLSFTITVTGTNDVPVISTGPQFISFSGGTSVPGGNLTTADATSGTLSFTDVDLTDTHKVATRLVNATLSGPGAATLNETALNSLAPKPMAAFEQALSATVAGDSTGTGSGTINWKLADLSVYLADFIPKGETLTLTYAVTVTDSQGATSTQDVTVAITGTDSPAVVWVATTTPGSPSGGLWSDASNWETGTVPTATDDAIIITNQLIGLTPSYPVTINSDVNAVARTVTLNDFSDLGNAHPKLIDNGTLTIGGEFSIAVDSILDNFGTISVGGLMEVLNSSVLQNSGQIILKQGGDFENSSTVKYSGTVTNSGTIEVAGGTLNVQVDIANSGGIIQVDDGVTLKLNGTTITGGTINDFTPAGTGGNIDVTSASTIAGTGIATEATLNGAGAGSTVHLDAALTLDYVKLNSITIENGPLTLKDTVEVAGAVTLLDDTVTNNGTLQVDGGITLKLNGTTINGGSIADSGTIDSHGTSSIGAAIGGSGTLNVVGGTLTLSGLNTYSGVTTIDSGAILAAGAADVFSANSAVTDDGKLDLGTTDQTIAALNGTNTAATVGSFSGTGTGPAVLTVSTGGAFAGVIEDGSTGAATALTLTAGTETLTGDNTYTGATTINGGTLKLSGTGSIAASSDVIDDSTFDISATTAGASIVTLSGTGNVTLGGKTLTLSNASTTFDGAIDGTGGLTLTTGTETLTGNNLYSGATTINGGTLALKNGGSIAASSDVIDDSTFDVSATTAGASIVTLSGTGNVTLGGKTLTLSNASTTFDGAIDGTGGLTLTTGTETLTGNNLYSGATTINGGTLALKNGGSIAASSDVIDDSTFDISATTAGASIVTLSGTGNVTLGAQTLTLSNASTTFSGAIDGTGGLTLTTGTETLTGVNLYSGATTINGGTLKLSGSGSIADSSGVADGGAFDISGTTSGASITTLSGSGNVTLGGKTLTLTAGAGSFSGAIDGSGGLTVDGSTTETLSGTNLYSGATTIGSGETLALSGAGSIADSVGVVDNGGTFDISATTSGASITTLSGSGTVALGSKTLTLTAGAGTFSGVIDPIAGSAAGLTVDGTGTETLSGVNTYTGLTTIGSGETLALSGSGSIADSSGVADGGTFEISGLNGGTSIATLSGAGNVTLGANTLTLSNASTSFDGAISGTGGLTVDGSGIETLSGINTYSGATTIGSGETLKLSDSGSIADSSGIADGGIFDIAGLAGDTSITTLSGAGNVTLGANTLTLSNASTTFDGAISGTGGLTVDGSGIETLSGINTYSGATTIGSGETLKLSGSGSIADSSGVADSGTLDITNTTGASITTLSGAGKVTLGNETLTLTAGAGGFSGVISGAGGLTVDGSATETLTGINTYTGATTVGANETLALTGAGSIAASSGVIDDGAFDISAPSLTNGGASIVTLSGSGTVDLGANTLTLSNASTSFDGAIGGTGGLTLTAGTETLTGGNALGSFSGAITINGGTLVVDGDIAAASATIGGGGTLDLGGADAQAVTFNGAGTLQLESTSNFTGTVSGLAAGDIIDLVGTTVTSAVWDGSTLALNGVNTAFHVSALPAGDTFAFKSDGHGGTELEVLPQTLAVGSTAALGVEQAAIPLHFSDTLTNDALTGGGVSLTAFVIGNIPAGATLSDGTHTQTVSGGTLDVAGWNLGSLTITPTNDANFTLSALATATDTNGFHYTVPASELVTVNPTAPALTWSAAVSGTETQVTLGTLAETITGQTGDSNAANTLTISGAPAGVVLSDGHGHSATSDGATAIDVSGWTLSSLSADTSGATVPAGNFTLTAMATEVDGEGNVSSATTASEIVTVDPTAPALTWSAAVSGTETQVTLGNLGESITGQTGDSNTANTLTISGAPAGVVLSDGHGHSATSDGTTAIDVSTWTLSSLSADTSGATVPAGNFTLTATATEVDGEGNVSSATTASEIVTVNPTAPALTWSAVVSGTETQVTLGNLAETITGQTGDSNAANTLAISGAPAGVVLSDGHGHSATSDGATAIDVSSWTLSSLSADTSGATVPAGNFTLTATATEKDANGDVSTAATASEAVTVAPEVPTVSPVAEAGVQGTAIALDLGVTVNGLTGDSNSLASVVVSAIPVGAILSDDQGHSFTATTGSGNQQVDVHGWDLAHLTITPVDAASFVLNVTATVQDAEGDLSAPATATEAVTVTAPASAEPFVWIGGSEDWSVAGDWNNGTVPGAGDQIQINTGVIVTIGPSDSVEVDSSLLLDGGATLTGGPLTLGSGGTLDVEVGSSGASNPDATLDGVTINAADITSTIEVGATTAATLLLDDGTTIAGGTLTIGSGGTLDIETGTDGTSNPDATLDGVRVTNSGTVEVDQQDNGAVLELVDGTTITGGTLAIGDSGTLDVEVGQNGAGNPDATLDDVNVTTADNHTSTIEVGVSAAATLTLDDGTSITGGTLTIGGGSTLDIEYGTNGPGATLDGVTVDNSGTVQVDFLTSHTSILTLDGGTTITGGALTINSSGALDIQTGPEGHTSPADATLDGVAVANGANIEVLTASGTVLALDGGTKITGGSLTIDQQGTLDIQTGPQGHTNPADAVLDGVTVANGGNIEVLTASGTILALDDGTTITGGTLTVDQQGTLEIINGSNTIGATLNDVQVNNSGTIEVGTTVIDPTLTLDGGTVVSGGTLAIGLGDTLVLNGATINGGATVTNHGLIDVTGSSTIDGGAHLNGGSITIESGQTLTLGDATTGDVTVSGTTISFDDTGDTLNLGQPLSFTANGFAYGDTIDLAGIDPATVSISNSGALQISYGVSTITLAGNYDPASISVVSDGNNGTVITDLTPTITITDRTTSGLDFHAHNALADMGSGAIQTGGGSTFTIINTVDNHQFVVDGNNFNYGTDSHGATTVTGTITSFHEFNADGTTLLADFTGLSVDAATWMADVQAAAAGNHAPIDILTSTYAFNFNGGSGPDSFGSAGHADTLSGTGVDFFDGGGASAGARDILTGGAGSTFVFGQGYGALTITNFDQGNNTGTFDANEGDQIQLNGLTAPTALQVSYAGGNTILDFGGGDVVTLLNVSQTQYEALNGTEFTSGGNGNNGGNNGGNGNNNGPAINNADNTVTYTGTAVLLDPSVTVTDTTGGTVNEVNAWISSGFQNGDTLTIQGSTGTVGNDGSIDGNIVESGHTIHYHYDNTTSHTIDLTSSTATLADFDAALQLIQFSSTSSDVTAAGTDTSRTITWAAHETTGGTSANVTTTVDIVPVLNSFTLNVAKGGTVVLSDANFSVSNKSVTDFFSLAAGSVVGGEFDVFNGTNWVSAPTGGFTIAEIEAGHVRFVQDGTTTVPDFSVWVSDGHNASPAVAPTINLTDRDYAWNEVQYPTVVQGVHQFGVNPQYDAAAGIVVLAPGGEATGYATTDASYVNTRYVEALDPFFLPGHHGPQSMSTTTVDAPARSNFIVPNVGSALTPEGIYVYKGQLNTDGTGGNALWEITATRNSNGDGGVTFSSPIQIGTALETQNTNYLLTESFKNDSSGMATSYDIAWDQYDSSNSHYKLELQITQINSDGSFGASTIFSPAITEGGATSVTVDTAHMPAWEFRSVGSSTTNAVYALAIAETDTSTHSGLNLTGQQHDVIHFQGYAADGSLPSGPGLSFTIQPDLVAYAPGATNHIVWQTIASLGPYPGQTAQAIQFVQVSAANNGQYAVAWNETVNDSAGTHDQVEFVLTNVFRTTFQIADGNAQNVRIGEFADPTITGQDDVVVVYGDDTGTHILEYGVTTDINTHVTTVATLASFTDPTTQAFGNLTVMGDGRITLTYDNLVNASPDETSQYLFKTFDLRTAGLTADDSGLGDGQDKYFAGTHYTDNVHGESGVNNEYYFVGQNTPSGPGPTDHFTGGSSAGWNVAIFSDARSDYTITPGGPSAATVTSNGIDSEHTGSLVASNVQVLSFGPATDPTPHNNIIDVNGGTDVVIGGNSSITIEAGSTAEIDTASYSGSVTFAAASGTLVLDQPGSFTGQIAGIVGSGNVLDLHGFGAGTTTAVTGSGSFNNITDTTTLTVTDSSNNQTQTLTLAGNLSTSTWTVTDDGHGGVNIVDPPATSSAPAPVVMHDPGPAPSQTIVASAANQTLTGTAASDTFVFNFAGVGQDTVANFHPTTDVLQFASPIFGNAQAALNATQDDGHGNTVINIDALDTITLSGVLKAQLHASDFHFV